MPLANNPQYSNQRIRPIALFNSIGIMLLLLKKLAITANMSYITGTCYLTNVALRVLSMQRSAGVAMREG